MRKLAVFDIDHTIYNGSLMRDLFRELPARGIITEEAGRGFDAIVRAYGKDKISYTEQVDQTLRLFAASVRGVHYGDVVDVAKEVVADALQKRSRYVSDLLETYKKEGRFLLTVSQSPKLAVDLFAGEVGFDKSYGTVFDIGPSGKFTGEIVDFHLIMNKGSILKRVIEQENLTLENSFGIGDADSDISFLEMVENPTCFNPTEALYRQAKRLGWEVVVEVRDIAYTIQ